MITLRTGTPGACKTLSAVAALAAMLKRWEAHPEEARPVFVHGVKDLALPHSPVPLKEIPDPRSPRLPALIVPDWDAMPDGSYVLLDEAQSFFSPRSAQSEPLEHVRWLNTHRHRGFDIEVITQHPRLIDTAVRALVGKHLHFRRMFGGQRSIVYEWDACSDNLTGLANAVTSYFPFPKQAFSWYKSAEVHTKQRFKLPRWLVIPFIGVALGVVAVPMAYTKISALTDTERAKARVSSGQVAAAPASSPSVAASQARPVYVPDVAASAVAPAAKVVYLGCISTGERCACIDDAGLQADVEPDACWRASRGAGGLVPYPVRIGSTGGIYVPPASASPKEESVSGGAISLGGNPRSHILGGR